MKQKVIWRTETGLVTDGHIIAVPLGATIQEQLDRLNMSVEEFSQQAGLTQDDANRLLDGSMMITPDIAERLERVLGIPAKYWIALDKRYRDKLMQMQKGTP